MVFIAFLLLLAFALLYLIALCFLTVLMFVYGGSGAGVRRIKGLERFLSFRDVFVNLVYFLPLLTICYRYFPGLVSMFHFGMSCLHWIPDHSAVSYMFHFTPRSLPQTAVLSTTTPPLCPPLCLSMFLTPVASSSFGSGPSISFSSNSGDVASSVPVFVRGEGCAGATLRRLEKV